LPNSQPAIDPDPASVNLLTILQICLGRPKVLPSHVNHEERSPLVRYDDRDASHPSESPMNRALALIGLLLLAACGGGGSSNGGTTPPPPAATPGLAQTSCGAYQGNDRGGSWSFLGIRFAAAPTGARRWRSPEPPACPSGTVAANVYAPVCPQLDVVTGLPEGDEDCLAVNVFAPKATFPADSRPVMVFVHGGGNVQGSAREEVEPGRLLYDGAALAETTGNVVVTLQYRLGPLGWLVHPALDAEAPDSRSGNYALEDQIAALRWVQRNIAAFGGNKDRVMIFGESAGGLDVCALIASPAAAGLFNSALIESGGCVADTHATALATGATLADNVGCSAASDVAACLRSKSPAELLSALPPVVSIAGREPPYQPSVDGSLLPTAPLDAIRTGQHNRMPVVIGTNADETGREVPLTFGEADYEAFLIGTISDPGVRARVAALYSSANFGSARLAYVALTSDVKFTCPSRTIARALAGVQTEPVYRYLFTEVPDAPASHLYGAFHGLELLFVFGALNPQGYTPTAAERALSTSIQDYWGSFAASGRPIAAGAPVWTQYDQNRDNYLDLDSTTLAMGEGVNTGRCDFWATLGL
jgi:para-nitrobenzyl esterase